jgi:hypothetical protein
MCGKLLNILLLTYLIKSMTSLEQMKTKAMELSRDFVYLLKDHNFDIPEKMRVALDHRCKELVEATYNARTQEMVEIINNLTVTGSYDEKYEIDGRALRQLIDEKFKPALLFALSPEVKDDSK